MVDFSVWNRPSERSTPKVSIRIRDNALTSSGKSGGASIACALKQLAEFCIGSLASCKSDNDKGRV